MSTPIPHKPALNPLLNAKEVACILGVSLRTVRRLIASQKLQSVRIGRSVRVQHNVIQALIEKGARR